MGKRLHYALALLWAVAVWALLILSLRFGTPPLSVRLVLMLATTALSCLPISLVMRREIAARERRATGLCPSCGYDLRATPGRCPECGTVPSRSATAKRT